METWIKVMVVEKVRTGRIWVCLEDEVDRIYR